MDLVARLAELVGGLPGRVLVGVDGPDTAGKTTLADRLAAVAPGSSRLSIDDFLRPRGERYRRGELSPEGCYEDTFDLEAFAAACRGASAPVIADGVFLLRPQLRELWTLTVHLRVSDAEVLRRAVVRDRALFGPAREVERRYRARYLPAQALYRADADPEAAADVLVDNEDPQRPEVLRFP